jgi:hypothetical protein
LVRIIQLVREELTPDLLTGEYAKSRTAADHPLKGYCYVAAEAVYHLAGDSGSELTVYRCSLSGGGTHWWLCSPSGDIIDPTAEQFPTPPPYSAGSRTHFLSVKPSNRTSKLIARVRTRLATS